MGMADSYRTLSVERWRLDLGIRTDQLPVTLRAVFRHAGVARMVLAEPDGTLLVADLPDRPR